MIEHAKANPGKLNFASFSLGSTSHLMAESLQHVTGTKMNHVPFKGSADAGVALVGGQVDFLFDGPTTALNYARAGPWRPRGPRRPLRPGSSRGHSAQRPSYRV